MTTAEVFELRIAGAMRMVHGQSRRFSYTVGGEGDPEVVECFVLRYEDAPVDTVVAYRNWCPHVGTDLDMGSGRFYSRNVARIYCHTHGAQFQAITGECDFGPCVGLLLDAYPVRIDGEDAVVSLPGPPLPLRQEP